MQSKRKVTASSTNSEANLMDQILSGRSSLRKSVAVPKKKSSFSFTPFNIEKIVARRSALEFSDDEDDGNSKDADEWDDEGEWD